MPSLAFVCLRLLTTAGCQGQFVKETCGRPPKQMDRVRRPSADGRRREGPRSWDRPAVSVSLPVEQQALRLLPSPPRYRFILALRELARRREPVRLELADGNETAGTIEVVGNDHLEIAEHHLGEARRQTSLTGRRLLALAAVAVVTLLPDSR